MCMVCGKEVLGRCEILEDTPETEYIEEHWERYGDHSVCKKHMKKLLKALKVLEEGGFQPEVNPKMSEEVVIEDITWKQYNGKEPSVYDSEYVGFAVRKEIAEMRKSAIDEALKLKDTNSRKYELVRKLIKEADGLIAEGLMAGIITPGSWTLVAIYEFIMCVAMSREFDDF
jgi:hypothetical protein